MRVRLGLGFLVAVGVSLLLAAPASACLTANLKLSPASAGPGDTVWYSIGGIEPGATYSFTVAGLEISGTNTSSYNGVSGTFTMPDLGSHQLTVTANGETDHQDNADGAIPLSDWMEYVPPAPAVTTSQPASSQPVEHHHPGARSHRPPAPIAVATHAAKKQRRDTASTGSAVGAAPAEAVGSEPGPRHPTSGSGSAKHSKGQSSSVPHAVLHALTSTTRVGPADVPTIGLLLMALIFIAGTGVAAAVIYILQTGPDPRAAVKAPAPLGHDPVEVELQDMIADGMARQLLADLDLVEGTPSSD